MTHLFVSILLLFTAIIEDKRAEAPSAARVHRSSHTDVCESLYETLIALLQLASPVICSLEVPLFLQKHEMASRFVHLNKSLYVVNIKTTA